ncbi:CRISPR-associated endonuclease Cas1 [Microvirga sp. 2MCAF38]|uniref:CRISPR-associated endonuclease Cas1 n=1 Tax=Microvirga sp. 2MCAF38 TaxID=3232989 RepID=UPI003F9BAA20
MTPISDNEAIDLKRCGISEDDAEWADRSDYWLRRPKLVKRRAKTARSTEPLILCGHGVSLRIEAGTLLIKNGFTHYPQKQEIYRFFRGSLDRPSRIILLEGSGSISFDVLSWLSEQEIPLVRIDWRGQVISAIGGNGYAANRHRTQWQIETRTDLQRRLAFSIDLIARKIDGCILTLEKAVPRSPDWEKAMQRAYADLTRLECDPPQDIVTLRALEAGSAAAYFRSWRAIPLKWKGTSRHPIPEQWQKIKVRTSGRTLAGNRNATHPINAILNYAYTALQSELQIRAVSGGYDPTLGIMHEISQGSSAFIFDIMEPLRPVIDHEILKLLKTHPLHGEDFILRSDGTCRLSPQLAAHAARLVGQIVNGRSPPHPF